uniref:Reverse transcriptase n=1 Tax=Bombyx mori TaxID=7091 RepID=Q07431_BOMMO|nr:reverse transcriptase [Bombyx mori]
MLRRGRIFLPASTKAGKTRGRMKWSREVNLFIMRTYYYVTKLETDLTIYRKKLHEHFSLKYPNVIISQQRISDQKRAIERNKLLSQETLDRLKEEVRKQLEDEQTNNVENEKLNSETYSHEYTTLTPQTILTKKTQQHTNIISSTQTSHSSTQTESITLLLENEVDILNTNPTEGATQTQEVKDKFETNLTMYSGMDPKARPPLPKLKYSSKLNELIRLFNNDILVDYISPDTQLSDVHTLTYCTAVTISEQLKYKIIAIEGNARHKKNFKPPWQQRLEKDIAKLRADIGKLTQYINNNRSKKVVQSVEQIFKNTKIHTSHENGNKKSQEFLDTLKQKLALKAHRLKRYNNSQKRKNENTIFLTNEKLFYRNLIKPKTDRDNSNIDIPTAEQLEMYWARLWENSAKHNDKANWITEEKERWDTIEEMQFDDVTEEEITTITARLHNWKSPGIDKIHNFWFKKLICLHKTIAKNLTDIISGNQSIPEFIATGITYMIPKGDFSIEASQYRPITCLPTIYKILTTVITKKINSHIEHNNILAEEQKGCRRGHMGCKEQLIIDSTIMKHATTKNRNLHCTYIDYKKAFDSIPHSWLIQVLEIYKINPIIISFLRNIMTHWQTTLKLKNPPNFVTTRQIAIKKGIYQGDSLSPLWFCLALNPLSINCIMTGRDTD